jgi:undecaprenyl-diphosphatase
VVVGLNDGICGKLIKPIFQRERPPVAGLDVILRSPHYGGYSFPSNHAANMFCLLGFVGYYFPRMRVPLFLIGLLTAYSRVYCGVHFPGDVLGGALIGLAFGLLCARLFQPFWKSLLRREFFQQRARRI